MEAQYNAFSLDLSWDAFASLDRPKLDKFLEQSSFSTAERELLIQVWQNHPYGPSRKQNISFFRSSHDLRISS
jgi:hypothetical protein